MMVLFIVLGALALLVPLLFLLAIRGRSGHPGLSELSRHCYAHRGLHGAGRPENSLAAFRAAKEAGYGVELDVHMTADGELVVIHDSTLDRVTGQSGTVEKMTLEQLKPFRLEGTQERIPTFQEVLELFDGQVPLIVELKPLYGNHPRLSEAACRMMQHYKGPYCMESFDPRCVRWLKKNRPDIIRGQLAENYFAEDRPKLPLVLKWALTHNQFNFLTKPDFVAYRFADRNATVTNRLCMRRMTGVSWTLTSQEEWDQAISEGWIGIFEGFLPNSK